MGTELNTPEVTMIIDLLPRTHARFTGLALLGSYLDGLVRWLAGLDYSPEAIRRRIGKAPLLESQLRALGISAVGDLSREQLLDLAPCPARQNCRLAALVRSLAAYLDELDLLLAVPATAGERLAGLYLDYLAQVRGCAAATVRSHARTVRALLAFLRFDDNPAALRALTAPRLEAFVQSIAKGWSVASRQCVLAHLRSFLRFLASRGQAPADLGNCLDSPRRTRHQHLPKALPWSTVQAFLAAIDRTTPGGRRDYAMFLLMATYGLRSSEIAALTLDSIAWRAGELRVDCPKTRQCLVLPLTDEAGAAVADYLLHARPAAAHRAVFVKLYRPRAPLSTSGVRGAFRRRLRRDFPSVPAIGAHCLRHSLAVRLLRRNQPLHAISSLLGHRSPATTSTYLRLDIEDLRRVALDLPAASTEAAR